MKLTASQSDMLRLIKRSKPEEDGWYRVISAILWRILVDQMPDDLVEFRPDGEAGAIRLTERGQAVSDYLA